MNEKELKKLSRLELLELLVAKSKECDELRTQLNEANARLESRRIQLEETGNIAQAALALNGVFEAAQAAADQYLENIEAIYQMQLPHLNVQSTAKTEQEGINQKTTANDEPANPAITAVDPENSIKTISPETDSAIPTNPEQTPDPILSQEETSSAKTN